MSAAVTDWFPGDVKPVHVGPYERQMSHSLTAFWFWSGQQWDHGGSYSIKFCCKCARPAFDQDLPWRGLASNPAEELK